jgi:hypothetical protein
MKHFWLSRSGSRNLNPQVSHCVKFSVEVASADAGAAVVYPVEFQVMMEDGNHFPDLLFKVDKTVI